VTDETAASEDAGSTPSVVDMSRDPRRSRQIQPTSSSSAAAAAAVVKTEPSKQSPSLKPEPSPREPVLMEFAKSELLVAKSEPPSTPKSPTTTTTAPLLLPPLPAYQL